MEIVQSNMSVRSVYPGVEGVRAGTVIRFFECGFGTVLIGGLYIPGSSSVPNDAEYLPAAISRSHCSCTKLDTASSRGPDEESKVNRSFGLIVAYSQAPSLSE